MSTNKWDVTTNTIITPRKCVELNSQQSTYTHFLHGGRCPDTYYEVPFGHDITSLSLASITDGLDKVQVHLGGSMVFEYKVGDINVNENILEELLPLSKCHYMVSKLIFCFDEKYLKDNESFEWIDEMRWEEEHSETKMEFFDGRDYRDGYIVKRFQVPTGNQQKQITKSVQCLIPVIRIETKMSDQDNNEMFVMPIWQKLWMHQDKYNKLVKNNKHELTILDRNIDTDTKSLLCRIKNYLRFKEGLIGFDYSF